MDKKLTTSHDIREFFYKKVKEAIMIQDVRVSEDVEVYLVHVLAYFSKSENLFREDEEGRLEYRALALKLYDAVFSSPNERVQHLRSLGDTALYHAGVFYEGLLSGVVDVNYYISMGGTAYLSLANMSTHVGSHAAKMYHQMGQQFKDLVTLLNVCCEKEGTPTDIDLIKILDRYLRTGSKRDKEILTKAGIVPEGLGIN